MSYERSRILREAEQIGAEYKKRIDSAMAQLETHDPRLSQSPLVDGGPYLDLSSGTPVMKIPLAEDAKPSSQIKDLAQGIEMQFEFVPWDPESLDS